MDIVQPMTVDDIFELGTAAVEAMGTAEAPSWLMEIDVTVEPEAVVSGAKKPEGPDILPPFHEITNCKR